MDPESEQWYKWAQELELIYHKEELEHNDLYARPKVLHGTLQEIV